jgi:hypothetical protein
MTIQYSNLSSLNVSWGDLLDMDVKDRNYLYEKLVETRSAEVDATKKALRRH